MLVEDFSLILEKKIVTELRDLGDQFIFAFPIATNSTTFHRSDTNFVVLEFGGQIGHLILYELMSSTTSSMTTALEPIELS